MASEHIIARTRDSERGPRALEPIVGVKNSLVESWLIGVVHIAGIFLACTNLSARNVMVEHAVSVSVGRVAIQEDIFASSAIRDVGVRVHEAEARAQAAETASTANARGC